GIAEEYAEDRADNRREDARNRGEAAGPGDRQAQGQGDQKDQEARQKVVPEIARKSAKVPARNLFVGSGHICLHVQGSRRADKWCVGKSQASVSAAPLAARPWSRREGIRGRGLRSVRPQSPPHADHAPRGRSSASPPP